ncbi:hypothetical protein C2869_10105 [Saccharobesus litoralis]|uniref:Glycosyl transferase family 1 domain-containing protein n=1 Tax=Saccharobesus litoralis TaxID=2172099 RepID=A0A2S0VRA8_9ALTE|nr:glycosyltransferase [Saccharobesus litoralis]AWB66755.1 hypothetical protein C2869_10105 [Saccharobesus litoralis]
MPNQRNEKAKKVAILTNMVAPYRVPFFKELAKWEQIKKLDILTCVEREVDRQWQVENDNSYRTICLSGVTLNLAKGKDAKRILHFRFGIITYLLFKRPDLLIIGDASWTSFIAAFFCRLFFINYFVWNEITTTSKVSAGLVANLRHWMYKGAKHIIASCSMAKDYLLNNAVPNEKISIVNNAVDNDFYLQQKAKWLPQRAKLRKALGIEEDSFCFIYVGQLISRKRVIETVELLAQVNKQTKVHLIVAGTGILENEMKDTAAEVKFSNISFCGYANPARLCQLYTASDALILLSEDEPWGMVVNECLLMGKPYIVSDSVAAGKEFLRRGCLIVDYNFLSLTQVMGFIENCQSVHDSSVLTPKDMSYEFLKKL